MFGLGGFPGPVDTPWVAPVTKTIGILSPLHFNAKQRFGKEGRGVIIYLIFTKTSMETCQTLYTFEIKGFCPLVFEREVKNNVAKVPSIVVFCKTWNTPNICENGYVSDVPRYPVNSNASQKTLG